VQIFYWETVMMKLGFTLSSEECGPRDLLPLKVELALPSELKAAANLVTEEHIEESVVCGTDLQAHLKEIESYARAGFDHIYVHQVGPQQEECIRFYEREILPSLKKIAA